MLFDWLVTGQVIAVNPAHAVCGPEHVIKTGKTPVVTDDETRLLLDSISTTRVIGKDAVGNDIKVSDLMGLRNRTIIAGMVYTFARVGAMLAMTAEYFLTCWQSGTARLISGHGKTLTVIFTEHSIADEEDDYDV